MKNFGLWNLALKTSWCELLVVNVLLKQLGHSQDINYFKVWLQFSCHLICKKCRFDTHNIIKV